MLPSGTGNQFVGPIGVIDCEWAIKNATSARGKTPASDGTRFRATRKTWIIFEVLQLGDVLYQPIVDVMAKLVPVTVAAALPWT